MNPETKKLQQRTLQQNVVGGLVIAIGVFFIGGTIYYLAKN
jgi:hypothetical protein